MTPIGISNIAWRYYIVYAVLNMAFVPVVHFFYEETAKLSLEEIDHLFENKYSGGIADRTEALEKPYALSHDHGNADEKGPSSSTNDQWVESRA